jgi:acyl carrier protein
MSDTRTLEQIEAWLVAHIAELLGAAPQQIDTSVEFDSFGLDSAAAVAMTGELEDYLGRDIDPSLAYDYPTIEKLSRRLADA